MLNFLANIRLKMMEDRTSVDGAKFTLDLWLEKRSPNLSSLLKNGPSWCRQRGPCQACCQKLTDLFAVKSKFILLMPQITTSRVICVPHSRTYFTHLVEPRTCFSTEPQRTNMNLQTGLRSNGGPVLEKSRFSDRGGHLPPPVWLGLTLKFNQISEDEIEWCRKYLMHLVSRLIDLCKTRLNAFHCFVLWRQIFNPWKKYFYLGLDLKSFNLNWPKLRQKQTWKKSKSFR